MTLTRTAASLHFNLQPDLALSWIKYMTIWWPGKTDICPHAQVVAWHGLYQVIRHDADMETVELSIVLCRSVVMQLVGTERVLQYTQHHIARIHALIFSQP